MSDPRPTDVPADEWEQWLRIGGTRELWDAMLDRLGQQIQAAEDAAALDALLTASRYRRR